jgi:hypothetical protein
VPNVHEQNDADERDRSGDADHAVCAYAGAEKPYFKSLGLGHGVSPSAFSDSPAEPNLGIDNIFADPNNSNRTQS